MKLLLKIIGCLTLAIILIINFYPPLGARVDKMHQKTYENLAYYKDGQFTNLENTTIMTEEQSQFNEQQTIPEQLLPVIQTETIEKTDDLQIIWLGHSSILIQTAGKTLLIDPVLSEYTSPVQGIDPKRFADFPTSIESLPEIDAVLISHDHYDHLDYTTIKELKNKAKQFIVPLGVDCHLKKWGISKDKITALGYDDHITLDTISITATPARHYSGRIPWGNYTTLWCGYMIESPHERIFYSGDTGYGSHFKDIYDKFGTIDIALIESGQYDNSWHNIHMLPEETILSAMDLHTKYLIPVHNSAYSLAKHSWDHPLNTLTQLSQDKQFKSLTPMIGETISYETIDNHQKQWWKEKD